MAVSQETRRVIFHGHVQGVGFRFTTQRIARTFPVSGFVRNRADGTVELVARGDPEQLRRFLATVRAEFSDNLDSVDEQPSVETVPDGFEIRR